MSEILAYGYSRSSDVLRTLDADRIYIDYPADRRANRDEMLRDLRRGDIVRVIYFSDLGGPQWEYWRNRIEAKNATVEEHRPTARPLGRPRRHPDSPALRAAWLADGGLDGRIAACSAVLRAETGEPITLTRKDRHWLYGRYGSPGRPKPIKEG